MRLSTAGLILLAGCRLCSAEIAPLSVDPSQYWDGNDGPWSSFAIAVGTPGQVVRVLPSTAVAESWAVLPGGCPFPGSPLDCNSTRGGLFSPDRSTTWEHLGPYDLGVEENLNYTNWNNGDYGSDQLSLGWPESGGPTLQHQVIAGIETSQWFLGILGINSQPINLTNGNPRPSLLSTLRTADLIPSLSYGYTAGAPYRLKKVLASLTLGGYDASRFAPNGMDFYFAPDNSRDLVVAIQSVDANLSNGSSSTLLDKPTFAYIDSTVPHIWLPIQACKAFEAAFGITWDSTTDLYLINDTLHEALLSANTNITFALGNTLTGGQTISITLPYASFDLSVSWPVVNSQTRYFPLRRAANDTQTTLGRTFLQEAYLTVDYERANFSVSQAIFRESAAKQLVPITPPYATLNGTTTTANNVHHDLGAIIGGIVAGAVLLIIFALTLLLIVRHRKRKRKQQAAQDKARIQTEQEQSLFELHKLQLDIPQLDGNHLVEVEGKGVPAMADGTPIHEMGGEKHIVEMEGHDVAVMADGTPIMRQVLAKKPVHELPGVEFSWPATSPKLKIDKTFPT